jgi:hypothetical protein
MNDTSPIPNNTWMNYVAGGKNDVGEEIDFIYIKDSRLIVYSIKDKTGSLRWELKSELCPNSSQANALYRILMSRGDNIVTGNKINQFKRLMTGELVDALFATETIPQEKLFQESILYLDTILYDKAHFRYVSTAFTATIASIAPALIYVSLASKDAIYQILVGGFFGSCGAFVSVLQRFNNIIIPKHSTWRFTLIRALSRIVIGCIFGGLFVIANKSGMILNLLNTNSFLIYAFSFMCGLSERFFPDLMKKTESSLTSFIS